MCLFLQILCDNLLYFISQLTPKTPHTYGLGHNKLLYSETNILFTMCYAEYIKAHVMEVMSQVFYTL